jgi:hypothetical protein
MPTVPQFPISPDGYSPSHVDLFVERLAERANAHITALNARIRDLEEQVAVLSAARDAAERSVTVRVGPAGEVAAVAATAVAPEPVDWALAVIGATGCSDWSEAGAERAERAIRRRFMSTC